MGIDFAQLSDITLWDLPSTEKEAIRFSQHYGLLASAPVCRGKRSCQHPKRIMRFQSVRDSYIFKCAKCSRSSSFRKGSFFHRSKVPMNKILKFIFCWAFNLLLPHDLHRVCGLSDNVIKDWKKMLRKVCSRHFDLHPLVIGGPNHTVELEETLIVRRKRINNVRQTIKKPWIFGGIDRFTKEGFFYVVKRRSSGILIPLIQRHVIPGTRIVSDHWPAFDKLPDWGYPLTRVKHMNRHEARHMTRVSLLPGYFREEQWRRRFGRNPFRYILEHIVEQFPFSQ